LITLSLPKIAYSQLFFVARLYQLSKAEFRCCGPCQSSGRSARVRYETFDSHAEPCISRCSYSRSHMVLRPGELPKLLREPSTITTTILRTLENCGRQKPPTMAAREGQGTQLSSDDGKTKRKPWVPGHSAESTSYGYSVSASYAAILSRTLASTMCRINRRFLSTNASLSARQLSSNTPTA